MTTKPIAMRDALLKRIWERMEEDDRIFVVTADFGSPVLDRVRADYPDRFINVGVAEQNLINISAGLGLEGYTVFAYAIAPFITMRCFEQLRISLSLLSTVRPMNVNLIGVGAGYSYVVSGPTHQCYEDISLMRTLPSFEILSCADHVTAASFLDTCTSVRRPKYLRLDAQVLPPVYSDDTLQPDLERGFQVLKEGEGVCVVATGYMVHTALAVAETLAREGIAISVIDLINLSGFDKAALEARLSGHTGLITMEEGFRGRGGMDAIFHEMIAQSDMGIPQLSIGIEGGYRFELGTRTELHERVGIGTEATTNAVRGFAARLA